jgi:DNA-binding CsgD family transcriptional regulator
MQSQHSTIGQIIHHIGEDEFAAATAQAVCRFAEFELALIVIHRRARTPTLLFNGLAAIDGLQGVANYLSFTHRVNPMLQGTRDGGVFRARDFRNHLRTVAEEMRPYVLMSREEELGFRTIGWPARLEELGLYFQACGGIVELSVYREQRKAVEASPRIADLQALCEPIAAAFDRNAAIMRHPIELRVPRPQLLSPRERQITELLLIGCTTEAIALRLAISQHTVKDYRKQIFRKLSICSLAELFALSSSGGSHLSH